MKAAHRLLPLRRSVRGYDSCTRAVLGGDIGGRPINSRAGECNAADAREFRAARNCAGNHRQRREGDLEEGFERPVLADLTRSPAACIFTHCGHSKHGNPSFHLAADYPYAMQFGAQSSGTAATTSISIWNSGSARRLTTSSVLSSSWKGWLQGQTGSSPAAK